jgi:hypothetical protein
VANIPIDLSLNELFNINKDTKTYTYRDISTAKFSLNVENSYKLDTNQPKITLNDTNTSAYDKDAIKVALTNLFAFRQRTSSVRTDVWK